MTEGVSSATSHRDMTHPRGGSPVVGAEVATHCPYCALQCGMALQPLATGTVALRPAPRKGQAGGLCRKGWTAASLLDHPSRLRTPLVREHRHEPLRPASWDEAIERVVVGMRDLQARYGADAVGVFGGGGVTNETAYLLGKFARVALGTRMIDYNGRYCMSSAAVASQRAFGIDRGLPFPLADIAKADVVLLVGSNPAETMPPVMRYFDDQARAGGQLIVIDPRTTPTAARAHLHLQPAPGTDMAVASGLLAILLRERLVDQDFVGRRASGFGDVERAVAEWWPERVERVTGVPGRDLVACARLLATSANAIILTGRGAEQHQDGTATVLAFINLALALGLPGRPGSGYGTLTGQGNGQGGREHGQKADQLPGYRRLDDPAARAAVAAVWDIDPDTLPAPGVSAQELLSQAGQPGGVQGLLVLGSNPAVSAPDARLVHSRLAALQLLVVADPFLSETAELAHVVFPVAQWAEQDGTMTNLEGRVLRRRRALAPPAQVRTDLELIAALAQRLTGGRGFSSDAETVFAELGAASSGGVADYRGITWERLDAGEDLRWPCPSADHSGTPRLFATAFATPDGRARFNAVEYVPRCEQPDATFPLRLTTGRVMAHYQSGTQTRRVHDLVVVEPGPFVELHPWTAQGVGARDGELVRLSTRRGSVVVAARVRAGIRPDTVFIPFHWAGDVAANLLTDPTLDPFSRMPELKACAVRVELAVTAHGEDSPASGRPAPIEARAVGTVLEASGSTPVHCTREG